MSRLCAKPTCSDVAERWFDVCAGECEVVERSQPTPSTIAFCGSHAARFSVPNGWAWIALDQSKATAPSTAPQTPAEEDVTAKDVTEEDVTAEETTVDSAGTAAATSRVHTRDAPWFLANAAPSDDEPEVREVSPNTVESEDSPESTPSAGSLLHRAFHGPDRDHDVARAREAERDHGGRREERTPSQSTADDDDDVATVRDLASQRSARATTTAITSSYDVELPFPPVDAEPHVAVS